MVEDAGPRNVKGLSRLSSPPASSVDCRRSTEAPFQIDVTNKVSSCHQTTMLRAVCCCHSNCTRKLVREYEGKTGELTESGTAGPRWSCSSCNLSAGCQPPLLCFHLRRGCRAGRVRQPSRPPNIPARWSLPTICGKTVLASEKKEKKEKDHPKSTRRRKQVCFPKCLPVAQQTPDPSAPPATRSVVPPLASGLIISRIGGERSVRRQLAEDCC